MIATSVNIMRALPGDLVVLNYPHEMTPEQVNTVKDQLGQVVPDGCRVAVICGGELSLVRGAATPASSPDVPPHTRHGR